MKDAKDSGMFMKLFNYISGDNKMAQKVEMTAPVLSVYQNMNNELINKNSNVMMSMRFYIPKANQGNPPIPNQSDIFIITEPEMVVATYRFGGWADSEKYIANRDLLISKLGDQAKDYDLINMITAGYDSPMSFFDRRNEIFLKKKQN